MNVFNPRTGKRTVLLELKPMGKPGVCPPHCNGWTEQEDKLLLELWDSMSAAAIAERLPGRNERAVWDRVQRMRKHGIASPSLKQFNFSRREDKFIRENCATMTAKEIARHLHRTPRSVMARGHKIGVRFMKYGQYNHLSKYSDEDVLLIRALRDEHGLSFREIAEKFEISTKQVSGLYYRHLTQDDRLKDDMLR
jgi:DNA-binding NarL/FixJ family response regulator